MKTKKQLALGTLAVLALSTLLMAFSTVQENTEQEKKNLAVNQMLYEAAFNKGDFAAFEKLLAPDVVEHEELPGFPPNREGVVQFFKMLHQAFPDLHAEIEFAIAKDDKVVSYITITGTHKGEFMGMPATGKKIKYRAIDIIRYKDGMVVDHWGLTDNLTMMQQLGAIPMPEETSKK
ncbi:MAG: ester cyclase [bacterium]